MENKDKVVWITRASSGIGKATVKLLLQYGYVVYASAKRKEKILDLGRLGACIMPMDVSKDDDIQSGIDEIIAKEGRIDILINSAGDVFGAARLSQLLLPYMKRQKSGKIFMISSISRHFELSGWNIDSMHTLEAISSSIRKEAQPFGIDVILIEPDSVLSEWSTIAEKSLHIISEGEAYSKMAEKFWHYQSKPI